jgi:hypothetical protein
MSEDWVGCRVSLDCGGLGFFQGVICWINLGEQTVTIEEPFQNGLACMFPEITLNASDIQVRRFKFTRNVWKRFFLGFKYFKKPWKSKSPSAPDLLDSAW